MTSLRMSKTQTFFVPAEHDGKTVAATYRDYSVKIWDVAASKDTQTLKGPAKDAKGLAEYKSLAYVGGQIYVGTGRWNTEKKVREGEIRGGREAGGVSAPPA